MRWMNKSIFIMISVSLSLSQKAFASEEVSKASMGDASDVYLQAFYAAVATLLVVFVLYALIFRPKFKGFTE